MSDMEEMFMELTHSPVLFLDERGDPLTFVIKPCLEKEALREMIEVSLLFVHVCCSFLDIRVW
jgi:hypothetical protein